MIFEEDWIGGRGLQAIHAPEIFHDVIKGCLKGPVVGYVAPTPPESMSVFPAAFIVQVRGVCMARLLQ